jgi:hypothetical protein
MSSKLTLNNLLNKDSKDYMSDKQLLIILISNRQDKLTNVNAPLYRRLAILRGKVTNCLPENINPLN